MNKGNVSKIGIFTLLLISSLTIMVGTVIAPSLSQIAEHLGFTKSPGWLVTLPSLGVVLFAPLMGRLIDRKGAYIMMVFGLIPYALLGWGGFALSNPYLVAIDRILLGGATAAVQASGTILIAELFSGHKRMQMMAWQGMSIELGGVVFLSVGGILGEWGWQYPFFIYLIALVCLLLFKLSIPKLSVQHHATEVEAEDGKPVSGKVTTIFVCSALSMILFFTAFVGLPLHLPVSFGFSESHTGYFMAFISLAAVICASQMPKVVAKIGSETAVATGFLFFMTGLLLFCFASSVPVLFIGAISMGIGFGLTVPLLNHWMVEISSPKTRGRNMGYFSMGIFGGQFLSSFVTELVPEVQYTFLASAIIGGITAIFLFIKRNKRHSI